MEGNTARVLDALKVMETAKTVAGSPFPLSSWRRCLEEFGSILALNGTNFGRQRAPPRSAR